MPSPLFGLVLAGGASTRMGRDKAGLAYHGRSQLQWTFDLVAKVCDAAFVSVRPDQRDDALRASFPQIVDLQPGIGPIAGISAALQQHPKAAWLVVACDLPFMTDAALLQLIEHRDPTRVATAYRSSHDRLPEPLCAIWEPTAREPCSAIWRQASSVRENFSSIRIRSCSNRPMHGRSTTSIRPIEASAASAALLQGRATCARDLCAPDNSPEPSAQQPATTAPCACSTTHCSANKQAAARRRSTRWLRRPLISMRNCRSVTRFNWPPRN